MRIRLHYFLLACLLIGAVGVPWAWRTYQARRQAAIERLEKELVELTKVIVVRSASEERRLNAKNAARIQVIADRLEKLTGKRPVRARPPQVIYFGEILPFRGKPPDWWLK